MATIDLGRIKFKWQGAYNGATAYVVDDVVESGGASYVCIAATTGNTPPNATYWELMADKGTDTSVLTTQGDVLYHDGTSLARLAAGTSGYFLKTQGSGANPTWAEVSTKLLGQTITVDDTPVNLGNVNQTGGNQLIPSLNTTYTAQSTSSYFVVRCVCQGGSPNHQKFFVEWSKDNSNWYHNTDAGNAGFQSSTPSGAGITWSSLKRYQYPQMGCTTDADTNRHAPATCAFILTPGSGNTHSVSTLYLRVGSFLSNSTSDAFYNRNQGNSTNDGSILTSSVEVIEYAL